jgi:hypothetical protein
LTLTKTQSLPRDDENKNPGNNCRGFHFHSTRQKRTMRHKFLLLKLQQSSSQLPVLSQHRAALAAHAPAMSRKRRAAAQQIAPGHAAGTVAQPRGRRSAWRKLGKIDGLGGGAGKGKEWPNQ